MADAIVAIQMHTIFPGVPILIATKNLNKLAKAEVIAQAKRLGIVLGNKSKEHLIKAIERQLKSGAKGTKSAQSSASKFKKSTQRKAKAKTTKMPASKAKSSTRPTAKSTTKKVPSASAGKGSIRSSAVKSSLGKNQKGATAKSASNKPVATAAKGDPTDKKSAAKKPKGRAIGAAVHKTLVKTADSKSPTKNTMKGPAHNANSGQKSPVKAGTAKPAIQEPVTPPKPPTDPKVLKKIRDLQSQRDSHKDIAYRPRMIQPPGASDPIWDKEPQKDRCGLFVRDPYWLHVTWDVTRAGVERAHSVLAEQWHGAKPILRLVKIEDVSHGSAAETVQADIEIRGGVRNWYIPWTGETAIFRVSIGYIGSNGRFQAIAISNTVKTPAASNQAVDTHWTDLGSEGEKILAMSGGHDSTHTSGEMKEILEDRLNRSLGAPALARLASAADWSFRSRIGFHFDIDVELVLYGATQPDSYLTVNEQPVALRQDGSFVVRLPFPDRRQVIPAVAVARDGSHQRTIVVAVERNTKTMQPLEQEQDTGD